MSESKALNAWIAVDNGLYLGESFDEFTHVLSGERQKYQAVQEDDYIAIANPAGLALRIGRIYRIRSNLKNTTLYFDKQLSVDRNKNISIAGWNLPTGSIGRLNWTLFAEGISKLTEATVADIPLVEDEAYVRELLQLAVMDDLLGPACGPHEEIAEMSVRDRYLVGKFAPQGEPTDGLAKAAGDEEPESLEVHTGYSDPGAEFEKANSSVEGDSEPSEEVDTSNNHSLVPSSFGLTFCVDGDVDAVEISANWGRYERAESDFTLDRRTGKASRVWKRIPCGATLALPLKNGLIPATAVDKENPNIVVQGSIRPPNHKGDRLVTLFLVNAQEELEQSRDANWIFQPELTVTATGNSGAAIFRRRPVLDSEGDDPEREALEMIYRKQVEFAVGHGISVHSSVKKDNLEKSVSIKTVVLPQSEVPVTETPGLNEEDRPAMRHMVDSGFLDMELLAKMEKDELVTALTTLTTDYESWIQEQNSRIGEDVIGHNEQAEQALERCDQIKERLEAGIQILADNDLALKAFRFANMAMAKQRIHSIYALERRRGNKPKISEINIRKNRSWRPFQLAFMLLSLPSLADPTHKDRTVPAEAYADLLWFPTGGGKTEAYLGVAAFTMAIRRFQGALGGYDAGRGLSVIMRYTLRLLTLQQFQRATTLICAMEVLRRDALQGGDDSLGTTPFTIGLWVGNKVTPGTTVSSHEAIQNFRDNKVVSSSPAQLTSCPWCGSEVAAGRDIEVKKATNQTSIYCGDKRGRCSFSKGKSSKEIHPGIPVLVVDEEIYHRPPTMMIATVDKFAMMAWRGQIRTLFGKVSHECPRHGFIWPDSICKGNHRSDNKNGLPAVKVEGISPVRPPDLIIQDEFHLISGPLGTMVGLYETAVDELCSWEVNGKKVRPKIIASTATVRKADDQVRNVFMRQVSVFPPHGLDVEDNFFSIQRSLSKRPGRRYLGICSPGSSRPAMLIRIYTALLSASQALFNRFGQLADPYMTTVGYFNSLRELGGMKRLAEDDVRTRSYRVQMSQVARPGLEQRAVNNTDELTARVSGKDIPKKLDQLEIKFRADIDPATGLYTSNWEKGQDRAVDIVLATNMLSVGVDVNRLGLMAVNGQPKGTAEYIQATSRVGRSSPGLVCTVLTWARPRDLSHYETFEHYHATFYKHVEAQSVTPFSPRAMDKGLTGTMLSMTRLEHTSFNPNTGAQALEKPHQLEIAESIEKLKERAWRLTDDAGSRDLAESMMKKRADMWSKEANEGGRILAYEKRGKEKDKTVALLKHPGIKEWDWKTVPMSMREVEPGVRLIMNTKTMDDEPDWSPSVDQNNTAISTVGGDDE
ncbi:helicase [Endozoicomonas sp. OPT23]|uniref:DISARM system helicase DrmA n=1 Tax=Endozoicomonas sp. OPT23 TaxID=2072845 RepID=UPI00129B57FC|nr:DISARM system helicase DrmA [Endozoicomonas sp. OPT23]MRI31380.1 helicase [Endozoicomonas sp. OPT23]